jgi:hypothetical protein
MPDHLLGGELRSSPLVIAEHGRKGRRQQVGILEERAQEKCHVTQRLRVIAVHRLSFPPAWAICAPQVRQANPVGGYPAQFAQRVVSCHGLMLKMRASRCTSSCVKLRCLPPRWPSAAHTVELLVHPISSPT